MDNRKDIAQILSAQDEEYAKRFENLVTALEVFANGDPISVGLDEVKRVSQSALDYLDSDF